MAKNIAWILPRSEIKSIFVTSFQHLLGIFIKWCIFLQQYLKNKHLSIFFWKKGRCCIFHLFSRFETKMHFTKRMLVSQIRDTKLLSRSDWWIVFGECKEAGIFYLLPFLSSLTSIFLFIVEVIPFLPDVGRRKQVF